jgi:ribosomal-protein-alanine N-acetyltransferase
MVGNDNLHTRTLPQVSARLSINGVWPAPITLARGWARASARPWNDNSPDALLRLDRGGQDFLSAASEDLEELSGGRVYSPALYPSATRIWRKCGYGEAHDLDVMERSTRSSFQPQRDVAETEDPDWDTIIEIDKAAFEGFWRMSLDGLREAMTSTSRSMMLTLGDTEIVGYAIVGAQWNVSYLQRIAVHPQHRGNQVGSDLVRHAVSWGQRAAAQTMVLNVRKENTPARRLYSKEGFTETGTALRILRFESSDASHDGRGLLN